MQEKNSVKNLTVQSLNFISAVYKLGNFKQ